MAHARRFGGFTTDVGNTHTYGGSLMFVIKVTHKQIKDVLGTSLSTERQEKYSSVIHVKHIDTGFIFSVYMSFGEWRIGSVDTARHEDMSYNETYIKIARELEVLLTKSV